MMVFLSSSGWFLTDYVRWQASADEMPVDSEQQVNKKKVLFFDLRFARVRLTLTPYEIRV